MINGAFIILFFLTLPSTIIHFLLRVMIFRISNLVNMLVKTI